MNEQLKELLESLDEESYFDTDKESKDIKIYISEDMYLKVSHSLKLYGMYEAHIFDIKGHYAKEPLLSFRGFNLKEVLLDIKELLDKLSNLNKPLAKYLADELDKQSKEES